MSALSRFRDVAHENGTLVAVTFPEGLAAPDSDLTAQQSFSRMVDCLALRVLGGLYTGSVSELAKRAGINKQTLSKRVRCIAKRLGLRVHFLSDDHRSHLSAAKQKKAVTGKTVTANVQELTPRQEGHPHD